MPLESGSSREVISRNISAEVKAGHPKRQAVAIAMSNAGKTRDKVPSSVTTNANDLLEEGDEVERTAKSEKRSKGDLGSTKDRFRTYVKDAIRKGKPAKDAIAAANAKVDRHLFLGGVKDARAKGMSFRDTVQAGVSAVGKTDTDDSFNESKHPRNHGEFAPKTGGVGKKPVSNEEYYRKLDSRIQGEKHDKAQNTRKHEKEQQRVREILKHGIGR